jgi:hypothetical protein
MDKLNSLCHKFRRFPHAEHRAAHPAVVSPVLGGACTLARVRQPGTQREHVPMCRVRPLVDDPAPGSADRDVIILRPSHSRSDEVVPTMLAGVSQMAVSTERPFDRRSATRRGCHAVRPHEPGTASEQPEVRVAIEQAARESSWKPAVDRENSLPDFPENGRRFDSLLAFSALDKPIESMVSRLELVALIS